MAAPKGFQETAATVFEKYGIEFPEDTAERLNEHIDGIDSNGWSADELRGEIDQYLFQEEHLDDSEVLAEEIVGALGLEDAEDEDYPEDD